MEARRKSRYAEFLAKVIELSSTYTKGIEDAVDHGIAKAEATLDQVEAVWTQDIKCVVKIGKTVEWRVHTKGAFILEDK